MPDPIPTPSFSTLLQRFFVEHLGRQRHTGKQIAAELRISPAPVSRILKRLGLNRIGELEPAPPVRHYERDKPGELIHPDIKKLGRFARAGYRATGRRQGCRNEGAGWEFVHVAIDDHSRLAFARIMANEKKRSGALAERDMASSFCFSAM